jgi:putative membrane-bound dehydrogenase-like protein
LLLPLPLTVAQEFIPRKQSRPPGPPLTPQEAIARMEVPEGFRVELVASEPQIMNPVAMAFDDRGRIFVTESFEYPRHEAGPGRDRIKILEDTDGDGATDKVTIFAEGLNIPSGIAVGHGGVWVANAPDLLFLKDTNGDDKADTQEVVVTGFGRWDTHELPNALTWGPDGYLYGLNGVFNPSRIEQQGRVYEFTCALFRIDPRTRRFELFCEGTSNPWGVAFNRDGSAFISACVIDHLWHLTETGYYHRQGGPYPPHTWKIESIVDYKHQAAAYCGIEFFDSPAYPKNYRNRLFMGNIHGGCINVDQVEPQGSTYAGKENPDFLTANDVWFMPVAQKVGPDGCLYVLDWYDRYHCYQDAMADAKGVDRGHGRLYRIVYGESRPKATYEDFSTASVDQLMLALADPNVFNRRHAQLQIDQRPDDPSLTQRLLARVADHQSSQNQRLHALWASARRPGISASNWLDWLNQTDPLLVAWAARLAGDHTQDAQVRQRVESLAGHDDPRVRLQVLIAAGKWKSDRFADVWLKVASQPRTDPLLPRILWRQGQELFDRQLPRLVEAMRTLELDPSCALLEIAPRIVERAIATLPENREDAVDKATKNIEMIQALRDRYPDLAAQVMETMVQALHQGKLARTIAEGVWQEGNTTLRNCLGKSKSLDDAICHWMACSGDIPSIDQLLSVAFDRQAPDATRLASLQSSLYHDPQSLGNASHSWKAEWDETKTFPAQSNRWLMEQILRQGPQQAVDLLFDSLSQLPAGDQATAMAQACQKPATAQGLIERIEKGQLPKELVGPNQLQQLAILADRSPPDSPLRNQLSNVWGRIRTEESKSRQEVVQRMTQFLTKEARGDHRKGAEVYDRICGQCHQLENRGYEVGPNLTRNGRGSFDQLIVSVFDPSLVVGQAYEGTTVLTEDGQVLQGLIREKNDQQITLRMQGGKNETVLATQISRIEQAAKSLMPEGIEEQLKPQEIADLFAFLSRAAIDPKSTDTIPGTPESLHHPR